jgi:hypothetical protein
LQIICNSGQSDGATPGPMPNPEVKPVHVVCGTEIREFSGTTPSCYYFPLPLEIRSALFIDVRPIRYVIACRNVFIRHESPSPVRLMAWQDCDSNFCPLAYLSFHPKIVSCPGWGERSTILPVAGGNPDDSPSPIVRVICVDIDIYRTNAEVSQVWMSN